MLTTVTLHGALGEVAGRAEWILDVMSPGEAIRAIECQVGKLFAYLVEKDKDGIQYRVVVDGRDVAGERETLVARLKHYARIDFIPVPAGSSMGLWEAIAGVLLVVAGVVIAIASEGSLAWLSTPLIVAGIGMIAAGAIQMFFGPKPPVLASHASSDRGGPGNQVSSYLFNGPVNTIAQGGAVPVLYGRMIVGSQTISMGIRTASVTLGGDNQTSDTYRQALYDALNLGKITPKVTSSKKDKASQDD